MPQKGATYNQSVQKTSWVLLLKLPLKQDPSGIQLLPHNGKHQPPWEGNSESDCGEGSTCLMARWQTDADLSQDTQICIVQMYSEGHSPSALQQPSSFKFNNNSFMQNMRQSGAGRMEGWGGLVFLLLAGFRLQHSRAHNNIHWKRSQWRSCKDCLFSFIGQSLPFVGLVFLI